MPKDYRNLRCPPFFQPNLPKFDLSSSNSGHSSSNHDSSNTNSPEVDPRLLVNPRPKRLLPTLPMNAVGQAEQASGVHYNKPRRVLPATPPSSPPPLPPPPCRPRRILPTPPVQPAARSTSAGNDIPWPRYIRGYYYSPSERALDKLYDLEAMLKSVIRAKKRLLRKMKDNDGEDSTSSSSPSSSSSFDEPRPHASRDRKRHPRRYRN